MANIFKAASDKIRVSPMVVPIFLVFVVMFIIALGVSFEDYTTSKLGYEALPTRKANEWIIGLVALIPQVAQIGFGYVFISDTRKSWSAITVFLLHVVDVGTDVAYKAFPYTPISVILAWLESEIIFTLGSEIMLVVSFGMILELFPDFVQQVGAFFRSATERLSSGEEE